MTLQETIKLFGADGSVNLGPVCLDPLGLKFLAAKVGNKYFSGCENNVWAIRYETSD
ncbi:hypothetical protein LCGC14_1224260 [marine sediment metagenome]|uniref:Uncharacterized protein n=1 Tax=marine sediment metagenome TaxID=412755 RepID=A0A0F9NSQ0_9ZZZZ